MSLTALHALLATADLLPLTVGWFAWSRMLYDGDYKVLTLSLPTGTLMWRVYFEVNQ